jgi:hypothetical protein
MRYFFLGRIMRRSTLAAAHGTARSKCKNILAGTLVAGLAFVRAGLELDPAVQAQFLRHCCY